jgi:hypothetical protein
MKYLIWWHKAHRQLSCRQKLVLGWSARDSCYRKLSLKLNELWSWLNHHGSGKKEAKATPQVPVLCRAVWRDLSTPMAPGGTLEAFVILGIPSNSTVVCISVFIRESKPAWMETKHPCQGFVLQQKQTEISVDLLCMCLCVCTCVCVYVCVCVCACI